MDRGQVDIFVDVSCITLGKVYLKYGNYPNQWILRRLVCWSCGNAVQHGINKYIDDEAL